MNSNTYLYTYICTVHVYIYIYICMYIYIYIAMLSQKALHFMGYGLWSWHSCCTPHGKQLGKPRSLYGDFRGDSQTLRVNFRGEHCEVPTKTKRWENHGKTIGKWWLFMGFYAGFMGFGGIYPLVI